jgi:CheY-like chemotaxis protein
MARVLALVPDLLFGSQVQGMLVAAGHEVELIAGEGRLAERLAAADRPAADVLVIDLTNEDLDGPRVVQALAATGSLEDVRTLGFYSHVDVDAREAAERAGFDLVVPRSRMAREGGALVSGLAERTGAAGEI